MKYFDKVLHFIAGAVISLAICFLTGDRTYGVYVGGAVGWAKELYDKKHPDKHTSDMWDLIWTVIGSYIGTVIYKWLN